MPEQSVTQFYNDLADVYRYIFPNWNASVRQQGKIIHTLLQKHSFSPQHHTVYDCTCGIGTQVFGLAELGWRVHGTDISSAAIAKANEYKSEFSTKYEPTFDVANLLDTPKNHIQYDIVMSLDNAIPHFLSDEDLITALQNMKSNLKADGLLLISLRDYDAIIKNPPRTTLPSISEGNNGCYIIFQTWDWNNDKSYKLNMYVTHHTEANITTQCFPSQYRALQRKDLSQALNQVGFHNIQWLMPADSDYYQPIVIAFHN